MSNMLVRFFRFVVDKSIRINTFEKSICLHYFVFFMFDINDVGSWKIDVQLDMYSLGKERFSIIFTKLLSQILCVMKHDALTLLLIFQEENLFLKQ